MDAMKQNLIMYERFPVRIPQVYAHEIDVLNVAMFVVAVVEWWEAYLDLKVIFEITPRSMMPFEHRKFEGRFHLGKYGSTRTFVEIKPDCPLANESVGGCGRTETDEIKLLKKMHLKN